jgi:hypothetical protein
MVAVRWWFRGIGGGVTGAPPIGDVPVAQDRPADNRRMPQTVCCPNCWTWSDAGSRTTCKKCGSQLVLPDGRLVDDARTAPPPPPSPAAAGLPPATVASPPAYYGAPAYAAPAPATYRPARDWVAICRWITIGYGVLSAVGLIALGLLLRHISVPVTDPNTGLTTVQTFDIGAAFASAAVLLGAVTALFAWLTQYTTARVIFLLLDALALLSVFSGAGSTARSGGFGIAELISVAVDLAYGAALVMSLVSRPQPAYG